MSIAQIKNQLANWREWEINPIVIKELRQAVRSRAVAGMLLLMLTVLFLSSLSFLITNSFEVNSDNQIGAPMFQTFVVILAFMSIFFIPLYVGVRVAAERQENNADLLYVTTLSPARIIRGKFFCGAYMAVLFFSACMPFMAFTNLLRGVDLPTVFFILFFLFLLVCAVNLLAIFFACLPLSRPFKILLALYGFFQSFWIIVPAIFASMTLMRSGVGAMMGQRNFWITTVTVIGVAAALAGLLYVLSVALISPLSANRASPVRRYITVIWALGGILCFTWVLQARAPEIIFVWTYVTFVLMQFSLLVIVSNSDEISHRVRREIPQSAFKRFFAFFFFNGAAGGLIWIAVIGTLTYFATIGTISFGEKQFKVSVGMSDEDFKQFLILYPTAMIYALDYALTALFIHRKFLPNRPAKITGLFAILIAGMWAVGPSIVLFFMNRLTWNSVEGLQLGNVFNAFYLHSDERLPDHLIFAGGWLILMLMLNAKWFWQRVKNFQPPIRVTPENSPPVLPQ